LARKFLIGQLFTYLTSWSGKNHVMKTSRNKSVEKKSAVTTEKSHGFSKKLRTEILTVYQAFWNAYLSGNVKQFASLLTDDYEMIGTTEEEIFHGKAKAVKYMKATVSQIKGIVTAKNNDVQLIRVGEMVMVNETFDLYVTIDGQPTFYGQVRASSLLRKEKGKWKVCHQHGSMPDTRASEGETIAATQIRKENLELREAVKRRTKELEDKNRELEIEAALEKVRTRSLAMHKSEELKEVVFTVFEQLGDLGIKTDSTNILIFDDPKKEVAFWVANKMNYATRFITSLNVGFFPKGFHQARKKQLIFTKKFSFKEKNRNWKELFTKTDFRDVPDNRKRFLLEKTECFIEAIATEKKTGIMLCRYSNQPFTVNETEILQRFTKVFEQAYTRFLDLQKAEAQSREAQIELGLERVRARAMAMQHSGELADLVATVFNELNRLDFSLASCIIWIHNPADKSNTLWIASDKMNKPARPLQIVPFYPEFFTSILAAWKVKDPRWIFPLAGAEKKKFQKLFFKEYPDLPEALKKSVSENKQIVFSASFNNFGALEVVAKEPLTDKQFEVLHRFGKVFNSSYTRFNDLKKAEAQAREAQIEVAVERVRARALAMHKSEEISATVNTLRHELVSLNIPGVVAATISLRQENGLIRSWDITSAVESKGELHFDMDYVISLEGTVARDWIRRVWDPQEKYFVFEQDKDDIKQTIAWVRKYRPDFADGAQKFLKENNIKRVWHPVVRLAYGKLSLDLLQPPVSETEPILLKMGAAFDLAYKRFLDLQKAEAQTREAQIEVAVERVRARALAMHKSEEIIGVAKTLRVELDNLKIPGVMSTTIYLRQEDGRIRFWDITTLEESNLESHSTLDQFLRLEDCPADLWFQRMLRSTEKYFIVEQNEKELKKSMQWIKENVSEEVAVSAVEFFKANNINHLWHPTVQLADGRMNIDFVQPPPAETESILIKMGAAFDLAHKRFLDLKKAEAQSREAQIEAALERVRAGMMAMHKSEELPKVMKVIAEQLTQLGVAMDGVSFMPVSTEKDLSIWTATDRPYPVKIDIPYFNHPIFNTAHDAIRQRIDFTSILLSRNEVKQWWKNLFDKSNIGQYVSAERRTYVQNAGGYAMSITFKKYSSLSIVNYKGIPFSDEENFILKRFANVFEQTYTRFLDLQKAEAQAREAQIEAALERVRSASLAMHKSDQIREIVKVVFARLKDLNFAIDGAAFIGIPSGSNNGITLWVGDEHAEYPTSFHLPFYDNPIITDILTATQSGFDFSSRTYTSEEKNKWFSFAFQHTDFKSLPEQLKTWILEQEFLTQSFAIARHSMIGIHFHHQRQLSENEIDTLKRFSKVFEQGYIRFLDLQKAEAQAREAQIQLALERVRAKAIGMHHSSELSEVLTLLFQQYDFLDIHPVATLLNLFDIEKNTFTHFTTGKNGQYAMLQQTLRLDASETWRSLVEEWKAMQSQSISCLHYPVEVLPHVFELFKEMRDALPPSDVVQVEDFPQGMYQTMANCKFGNIGFLHTREATAEEKDIVARFAREFERLYQRFLDLQKAEAQARESQIELAIERVRARALAMHHSEELGRLVSILFDELVKLDLVLARCIIWILNKKDFSTRIWIANAEDRKTPESYHVQKLKHPYYDAIIEAWKRKTSKWVYELKGSEKKSIDKLLLTRTELSRLPKAVKKAIGEKKQVLVAGSFHNFGFIEASGPVRYSDEQMEILHRFSKVFDQAYTRFLDLQKAEAQAREAQIEAALERVRAKAMAMHSSESLNEVIQIISDQLYQLGVRFDFANFVVEPTHEGWDLWHAVPGQPSPTRLYVPYFDHRMFHLISDAIKNEIDFYTYILTREEKNAFLQHVFKNNNLANGDETIIRQMFDAPGMATSVALLNKSTIGLSVGNFQALPYTEEENVIFRRFGVAFEQAYTRFLDLQKAEAQAREAQIEAALEKVRSRSLAMHKSDELQHVIRIVLERLDDLGIVLDVANINIPAKDGKSVVSWVATKEKEYSQAFTSPWDLDSEIARELHHSYESGMDYFSKAYTKQQKDEYLSELFEKSDFRHIPDDRKALILSREHYAISAAGSKNSWIQTFSYDGKLLSNEQAEVLKRFARVFEQCYIRFQDLEKAEAQAREAQIEASLERVRAKAMAMHSSKDLAETIHAFYRELVSMNLTPRRCGLGLVNKETHEAELSSMNTTEDGVSVEVIGKFILADHPVLEGIYDHWLEKKEYHPVLRGNEIKEYYQLLRKQMAFPDYPNDAVQYGYFFYFEEGGVYAWTEKPLEEDELKIYRRFTTVLSLTYKRYKDLKDAEARAKEAVRQASLDRVRAEIASMRTVNDLDRITPLIWRELTTLGIPFVRCGVFIMDDSEKQIHTYLSTPDGRAIAAFKLPYESTANLTEAVANWRERKMYVTHWVEKDFQAQAETLVLQGAIASREQYLSTIPKEGIHLHFLPFLQGMLYVGNTTPLNQDDLQLMQSLADAFSTAYARYEDFNKLEAAKKQVENTLSDLKQAQQQLVQSEKMASLGELTAGIAHEIQNPLNFVNNFSEVNKELLAEMEAAIEKGDFEEARALAKDITDNQEKINHHGKRADGIVKSMLQHSRKSTGQKELTDINALCDEYLRLAYHGLRAKDKSFNAKFETDLDPSVGKLMVLSQDIGRVVLNLINNAFYAVSEKKKLNIDGYEPTVTVSTKRLEGKIQITVKDNGTGVPEHIKEKIFQPFFTTKPTGQGTGLGLSLAYDIITKGHGGELRVESKVGEGSEFIVLLPLG
jgi:signal transduction histidine kinase/ketosteroid isomerase-like protein